MLEKMALVWIITGFGHSRLEDLLFPLISKHPLIPNKNQGPKDPEDYLQKGRTTFKRGHLIMNLVGL